MKAIGLGIVFLLIFVFIFSGISLAVEPKDVSIGVTLVTLADPFFASLKEGLEARAKELGIGKLTIMDGQADAAKQLSQVENFIAEKYTAIIINPVESAALVTAAEAANKAGVIVITMDRFIDAKYGPNEVVKAHCGADAVDGGRLGMRIVADKLNEKYGEPKGKVLYIEGTPGSSTSRDRTTGVMEELEKYPNISIVAQQPGETRAKAMSLVENWLQMYTDIDGIYAYGGDGALGAVQAAEAAGVLDKIFIVGTGAAWDELISICDGRLTGTVDFNPVGTGRDGIDTIMKLVNNESVPEWVRTEAKMVTKENLDCNTVKK